MTAASLIPVSNVTTGMFFKPDPASKGSSNYYGYTNNCLFYVTRIKANKKPEVVKMGVRSMKWDTPTTAYGVNKAPFRSDSLVLPVTRQEAFEWNRARFLKQVLSLTRHVVGALALKSVSSTVKEVEKEWRGYAATLGVQTNPVVSDSFPALPYFRSDMESAKEMLMRAAYESGPRSGPKQVALMKATLLQRIKEYTREAREQFEQDQIIESKVRPLLEQLRDEILALDGDAEEWFLHNILSQANDHFRFAVSPDRDISEGQRAEEIEGCKQQCLAYVRRGGRWLDPCAKARLLPPAKPLKGDRAA